MESVSCRGERSPEKESFISGLVMLLGYGPAHSHASVAMCYIVAMIRGFGADSTKDEGYERMREDDALLASGNMVEQTGILYVCMPMTRRKSQFSMVRIVCLSDGSSRSALEA